MVTIYLLCLFFPLDSETDGKRGAINYHPQISRRLLVSAHVGIRVHTTMTAGLESGEPAHLGLLVVSTAH